MSVIGQRISRPPKKPSTREREYLRSSEIKAMIRAAKKVGRHGIRDGAIILLMFRQGLRTAELVIGRRLQKVLCLQSRTTI